MRSHSPAQTANFHRVKSWNFSTIFVRYHVVGVYRSRSCTCTPLALGEGLQCHTTSSQCASACTHETEDLTTSRFVRVIYSSQYVNRIGIVSLLRRCMPFWHKRWDDQPTLSPHTRLDEVCSMAVLPARTTTLLCLAGVSFPCIRGSVLSLTVYVMFPSSKPTLALLRSFSQARFASRTCTTRASGRRSKFGVHRRFLTQRHRCFLIGDRRFLTASSLNMLPRCYPQTTPTRADEGITMISIMTAERHSALHVRQLLSTRHLPSPKFGKTSWKTR